MWSLAHFLINWLVLVEYLRLLTLLAVLKTLNGTDSLHWMHNLVDGLVFSVIHYFLYYGFGSHSFHYEVGVLAKIFCVFNCLFMNESILLSQVLQTSVPISGHDAMYPRRSVHIFDWCVTLGWYFHDLGWDCSMVGVVHHLISLANLDGCLTKLLLVIIRVVLLSHLLGMHPV